MSLHMELERGTTVQLLQTSEAKVPERLVGYTLIGDEGSLHCTKDRCTFIDPDGGEQHETIPDAPLSEYAQELLAFYTWVTKGTHGPTDAVSERRSLAIVEAAYASAESGKMIWLNERYGEL